MKSHVTYQGFHDERLPERPKSTPVFKCRYFNFYIAYRVSVRFKKSRVQEIGEISNVTDVVLSATPGPVLELY